MSQASLVPTGRVICEENKKLATPITPINELSTSALLHRIVQWDGGPPQEINQTLTVAFGAEDYPDCVGDLKARDIDPQLYINSLDRVSSTRSISTWSFAQRFGDRLLASFRPVRMSGNFASRC